MRSASTVPEMFSTFPWPNGCSASARLLEVLTANRAMTAASRSTPEWMASEITDTEPMASPTISFPATSVVLEMTDNQATADFCRCASIRSPCLTETRGTPARPSGFAKKRTRGTVRPTGSQPPLPLHEGPAAPRDDRGRLLFTKYSLKDHWPSVNLTF